MNKEEINVYTNLFEYPTKTIVKLENENEKLQQENKQLKERIDKAIEYMQDFIFEGLLVNEDRKLIMYNQNLRKFEKILKGDE